MALSRSKAWHIPALLRSAGKREADEVSEQPGETSNQSLLIKANHDLRNLMPV